MSIAIGNLFVSALLRSPFHAILGKNLALIRVRGRKSGKLISTPINIVPGENGYRVISLRERTWWRNLRNAPSAELLLTGKWQAVQAQVVEAPEAVFNQLQAYFQAYPQYARYFAIRLGADGQANAEDVRARAEKHLVIQLTPRPE